MPTDRALLRPLLEPHRALLRAQRLLLRAPRPPLQASRAQLLHRLPSARAPQVLRAWSLSSLALPRSRAQPIGAFRVRALIHLPAAQAPFRLPLLLSQHGRVELPLPERSSQRSLARLLLLRAPLSSLQYRLLPWQSQRALRLLLFELPRTAGSTKVIRILPSFRQGPSSEPPLQLRPEDVQSLTS